MEPSVPKISSVSRGSIAACVTTSVATGPLSNCNEAVATSSTSRSKTTFAVVPETR